jgi:3-phosphoshikimate 1-carboxyvinyltransferase
VKSLDVDLTRPVDRLPDPLPVPCLSPAGAPLRPRRAVIRVPGSKSITNRAYLLAALASGRSRIIGPLRANDCDRLLEALRTMGAGASFDGDDAVIDGVGGRFPRGGAVNLGDGGAPTRFAIAAACLAAAPVTIDGSRRMRERPVAEGIDMLRSLGASIDYAEAPGRLPVIVRPSTLRGGSLEVGRTASSQFLSALLLLAPWLPQGIELHPTAPLTSFTYVDLTLAVLQEWGAAVDAAALRVPPGPLPARTYAIEPDASSALYWCIAAALVPGFTVALPGVDPDGDQPDLAIVQELARRGAIALEATGAGDMRVRGTGALPGGRFDGARCPDGALALAVASARAEGTSRITGLRTLRVKESDRIAALADELRRVGCGVHATDDAMVIEPAPAEGPPVVIETYDDHRVAMAFAVLGLARAGISIKDPACVAKSYPGFWRDLALIREER